MQHSHLLPSSSAAPLPEHFLSRLVGFADLFTRPTWSNVLVLLGGIILAPGRRTVSAALRILGRRSLKIEVRSREPANEAIANGVRFRCVPEP